jgi:hypothetical protein
MGTARAIALVLVLATVSCGAVHRIGSSTAASGTRTASSAATAVPPSPDASSAPPAPPPPAPPPASTTCAGLSLSATDHGWTLPTATWDLVATVSGCPNPLFKFTTIRGTGRGPDTDWGSSNEQTFSKYAIVTDQDFSGPWIFQVDARDASDPNIEATAQVSVNDSVAPPGCFNPTLSASAPSPQPVGTAITFTGSVDTCASPQYQFAIWMWSSSNGNGPVLIQRDWDPDPTLTWQTAGLPPGTYIISMGAETAADGYMYGLTGTQIYYSLTAP